MAPIIHLVRHAQGLHNLGKKLQSLPDPVLTELGREECKTLQKMSFAEQSRISLIATSPLSRAIQTAFLTFEPALQNGYCKPEIVALPDAQEINNRPCNTGLPVDELRKRCMEQKWPVDLSNVQEDWIDKTHDGRYSAKPVRIKARAKAIRQQLRALAQALVAAGNADPEIVLVTHGAYLHYLTDDWEDSKKYPGTGWLNCETRTYTFENDIHSTDKNAHIVETQESRVNRGKNGPALRVSEEDYLQQRKKESENIRTQRETDLQSTALSPNISMPVLTEEAKITP